MSTRIAGAVTVAGKNAIDCPLENYKKTGLTPLSDRSSVFLFLVCEILFLSFYGVAYKTF